MIECPVVSIQNLGKSYRHYDASQLKVFEGIDLGVAQGEVAGIIGPSGCGKTTLLRCICGFEEPDEGLVLIDGAPHQRPSRDVLMLFQDFNQLLPWKTVIGNVMFPLLATGAVPDKKEARRLAEARLNDVGLKNFLNSYPRQLSGGMKQRAAVARALALQPRVLLLDEPFAALDAITRRSLQLLTRRVCGKHGITVLLVTHSVDEAVTMSDKIVIMAPAAAGIKKVITRPGGLTVAECLALSAQIMAALEDAPPAGAGEPI